MKEKSRKTKTSVGPVETIQPEELVGNKKFTIDGMVLSMNHASKDEWTKAGRALGKFVNANPFWIGDWVIAGIDAGFTRGNTYSEAARITSLEYETIENYTSLSRRISGLIRRSDLTLGHHLAVRSLPPAQQEKCLNQAAAHEWTVRQLRERVHGETPKQSISKTRDELVMELLEKVIKIAGDMKKYAGVVKAIKELHTHGKRTVL